MQAKYKYKNSKYRLVVILNNTLNQIGIKVNKAVITRVNLTGQL